MTRGEKKFLRVMVHSLTLSVVTASLVAASAQSAGAEPRTLFADCHKGNDYDYVMGSLQLDYNDGGSGLAVEKYGFDLHSSSNRRLGNKSNVEFWLYQANSPHEKVLDHWKSGDNVGPDKRYVIKSDQTENKVKKVDGGTRIFVKVQFIFDERDKPDVSCTAETKRVKA